MHVNDISSELNNVDFEISLVISGRRWQNCPDTLAFDKSSNSIWNIFFNLNLNPIEPMNLLHFLAVISSPNERKMPDSLSPSQIHILLGDGEAKNKPIRTRWQLFLPQMREKWPMPCPHPRSTFYSGMERPRRNQLRIELLLEEHSTSFNLTLFTRRKTVINWRFNIRSNFPNESENVATATIPDARWPNNYCSYS